jgi:hypothetical protein
MVFFAMASRTLTPMERSEGADFGIVCLSIGDTQAILIAVRFAAGGGPIRF